MLKENTSGTDRPRLTETEWRVLVLLGTGKTNPAIAEELIMGVKAVENHIYSIYRKLGFENSSLDGYNPRALAIRWVLFKI